MFTLPNLFSLFRIGMVPVLVGLALTGQRGAFLWTLAASLFSDVADGFAARRLGQCSPLGSRLDTWGDLLTYAVSIPAVLLLWPGALWAEAPFVGLAIAAFVLPTIHGLIKFGGVTSYHTWGAKASALLIGPGVLLLLVAGQAWLFQLASLVVVVAGLEEMAITHRLDAPLQNVRSLWHLAHARAGRERAQGIR